MGLLAVAAWMALLLVIGLVVVQWIERPRRAPSLVLVVLDTVRADRCSAYGHARPTTPRLAALAAEGLLFEDARADAPWTLPSHASLFTGLSPLVHGCTWDHRWLLARHETMAERMAAAGAETFGVTTNVNASSLYHLDQGFASFVETWTLRERHRGLDDSGIANAEIRAWLERRDPRTPFFLFVNYSDAHLPYAPPPPWDTQFGPVDERARRLAAQPDLLERTLTGAEQVTPADHAGLAALYDGDVRAADARLGELLDLLERFDLAQDTLVIVTSDHGEQLAEHGRVDHQLSLAEELLRVPLVVRWPGRVAPARIPEGVQLSDLKAWIDDFADSRLPDFGPAPDRVAPARIAAYARPHDLVERVAAAGGDTAAIDRALYAAYAGGRDHGTKLLRAQPGDDRYLAIRPGPVEDELPAPGGALDTMRELARALDDALARQRFREVDEDFAFELAGGRDAAALEEARRLGYVSGGGAGSIGIHASEHWSAGRRAAARGDHAAAVEELAHAARLAGDAVAILFELAQAADRAHHADALGAIERFLAAVEAGSPAPATQVEWAVQRRDALRGGKR